MIDGLNAHVATLNASISLLLAEVNEYSASPLPAMVDSLESELQLSRQRLAKVEGQLKQAEEDMEEAEANELDQMNAVTSLQEKVAGLEGTITSMRAEAASFVGTREEMQRQQQATIDGLHAEIARINGLGHSVEAVRDGVLQRAMAAETENASLRQSMAAAESAMAAAAAATATAEAATATAEAAKAEVESATAENQGLRNELLRLQQQLGSAQARTTAVEEDAAAARNLVSSANAARDQAVASAADLVAELTASRLEAEGLGKRLADVRVAEEGRRGTYLDAAVETVVPALAATISVGTSTDNVETAEIGTDTRGLSCSGNTPRSMGITTTKSGQARTSTKCIGTTSSGTTTRGTSTGTTSTRSTGTGSSTVFSQRTRDTSTMTIDTQACGLGSVASVAVPLVSVAPAQPPPTLVLPSGGIRRVLGELQDELQIVRSEALQVRIVSPFHLSPVIWFTS